MTGGGFREYFGMKKGAFLVAMMIWFPSLATSGFGQVRMLDAGWHHLRNAGAQEWSEFPAQAEATRLVLSFSSEQNPSIKTLSLRQYDVKLDWKVRLNNQQLGTLVTDEKDLMAYFTIPAGTLKDQNTLEVSSDDKQADDIRLGEISLHDKSPDSLLSEGRISIAILDHETQEPLPARITIVNGRGILQLASATDDAPVALRPGYAYTPTGKLQLGLPAGTYTLYAGRGFEYGLDSARIEVKAGGRLEQIFYVKREVATTGWVSSDTHIHTFTWSRHGDASADERAITIAGEGIELPIMTDHNLHVDIKPFAVENQVVRYFTPVTGNEVTTPVGHFNVFPLSVDEQVINPKANDWETLEQRMKSEKPRAIILNHARDIHTNFRPHAPSKHLASAGLRLDGWDFFPNAMEVINSGSQQTDQQELMRDWFGMLNHGHFITPVGSSDSHDVSRFIVGQARTYIRCSDDDPANIDVQEAVQNFLDGSVMVSFGLIAEIEVNESYGPGELVPGSDEVKITVKVSGPSWTTAEKVTLYANGKKIREEVITNGRAGGEKWTGDWHLTVPPHDIFLVAVAHGPAKAVPYWPIAKPYQPASPEWTPGIFGLTGAVWLDGDRNRKRNSAREYAETLVSESGSDISALIRSLATFDESVSVQAAALLHQNGKSLKGAEVTKALRTASPETRAAFETVIRDLQKK